MRRAFAYFAGECGRRGKRMSVTEEGKVKKDVLKFLKDTKRYHMRMQSGRVKVRGGMMHLQPVGTADLLTFAENGRCIWLELKQLKGTQRQAQIDFEHRMRAMGHSYAVVRSVDDAVRAVTGGK
jgi:hypothetical protein